VTRTAATVLVLVMALGGAGGVAAQERCPAAAGPDAEAGWAAYRDGDMAAAQRAFDAALALCPDAIGQTFVETRGVEGQQRDLAARRQQPFHERH